MATGNSDPDKESRKLAEEDKGLNMRFGAWLYWLPLFAFIVFATAHPQGFGDLLALLVYIFVSVPIGIVVCIYYRKDRIGLLIAAIVLFSGPFLGRAILRVENIYLAYKTDRSQQVLERYCNEFAGEQIHRTVSGVEGVFQMYPTGSYLDAMTDKFERPSPWVQAQGTPSDTVDGYLGVDGKGYHFVEQLHGDRTAGPFYTRNFLKYHQIAHSRYKTDDSRKWKDFVRKEEAQVTTLLSKYGWDAEDLTTDEMRQHWVSGGRVKIVDLESGEVLAQHTGFYRGKGSEHLGSSWQPVSRIVSDMCDETFEVQEFLYRVLEPVNSWPRRENQEE